jgi:predicted choloylglycine hydrolase
VALLGRNLDYPSLGYAHEYSLVTVYRPDGARHAFASVGFPGLVGCLSGMNDAGLSLAILEVFQARIGVRRLDRSGMPYALCYRRILDECATVAEARALLERMGRTTITNLALADRASVAVLEVTPGRVMVRPAQRGACVCTNHFCSPDLEPYLPLNVYKTFDRFAVLRLAARGAGRLGVADLHAALHAARHHRETLQTMVFEPATLCVHLRLGRVPATAGELRTLELGPLFAR